jgi:TonB-dependent SusC/RagA subfamily outer membrane receptor
MRIKLFFIILLSVLCINSISAQKSNKKITITGTVLDVDKRPVMNAIIMIDGQKTNSITDSEGNYKIKVNPNALKIGIFTFGNGIFEEEISGRTRININFGTVASKQLPDRNIAPGEEEINGRTQNNANFGIVASQKPSDRNIAPGEEGVDIGYGYVKKKKLTTPVNRIDGTNKKYASYSSIYDMIRRECSGVQVNGTNIVIQDSRNLWGYVPPLFVVDGVYVNTIENISPQSVKSIEVLKGSSAAIYGTRGYGGVILIKTKTGNE